MAMVCFLPGCRVIYQVKLMESTFWNFVQVFQSSSIPQGSLLGPLYPLVLSISFWKGKILTELSVFNYFVKNRLMTTLNTAGARY